MYSEKYKKYKSKYIHLKNLLSGGSLLSKFSKLNQGVEILNSYFDDDWVLTGSYAIFLWAEELDILDDEKIVKLSPPNDIDAIIQNHMQPYSRNLFAGLPRKQKNIETSMTFSNGIDTFDLTFIKGKFKNVILSNKIKVPEPKFLLDGYLEDLGTLERLQKIESDKKKIEALTLILEKYNLKKIQDQTSKKVVDINKPKLFNFDDSMHVKSNLFTESPIKTNLFADTPVKSNLFADNTPVKSNLFANATSSSDENLILDDTEDLEDNTPIKNKDSIAKRLAF